MALTLTPEDGTGLAGSNSFASVAQADAYHDGNLYAAAWTDADNSTKEKALVMATTILSTKTRWQGSRKTSTQALPWPREGAVLDGFGVPANEVPTPIIRATSELAKLLISENLTEEVAQNDLSGLDLGKGALKLNFRSDSKKRSIPTNVEDLLEGLGDLTTGGSGITLRRVVR